MTKTNLSIVMVVVCMITAFTAYTACSEVLTSTEIERVATVGDLAEIIMDNRQRGTSMSKMLNLAVDGPAGTMIKMILVDAYKVPRYATEKFIRRAIVDFRNKWELITYESLSK